MPWTTPAEIDIADQAGGTPVAGRTEGGRFYQEMTLVDDSQSPSGHDSNPLVTRRGDNPNLSEYMSAALEANAENVAAGAVSALETIIATLDSATADTRWIWVVNRATMAGSVISDLIMPPLAIAPKATIVVSLSGGKRPAAGTALSFGISSSPSTYTESGTFILQAFYE